jgi:hypothetical protein
MLRASTGLGTVGFHVAFRSPLEKQVVGHENGQNQLQSLRGGRERECDSGVAAGRIDQHSIAIDLAGGDASVNHRQAAGILDAGKGDEELELQQDVRLRALSCRRAVKAGEGTVADRFRDAVVDFRSCGNSAQATPELGERRAPAVDDSPNRRYIVTRCNGHFDPRHPYSGPFI